MAQQKRGLSFNRSSLAKILRVLGITLLGFYFATRLYGSLWNYAAVESLLTSRSEAGNVSNVDFSLWDSKRILAYKDALIKKVDPPLAVLKIDRIGLAVSVFEGVDDLTLDRGVGRIPRTAKIGNGGNIGLAGHRDGFFRGLKDVSKGDEIQIVTPKATHIYTIEKILIVKPEDISVLEPEEKPTLTLVTCYPFYFVGHAPERYIIKASSKAIQQ